MKSHYLLKGNFFILCSIIFSLNSYAASSNETLVHYVYLGKFSKDTARIALNKMPPLDGLEDHHNL